MYIVAIAWIYVVLMMSMAVVDVIDVIAVRLRMLGVTAALLIVTILAVGG